MKRPGACKVGAGVGWVEILWREAPRSRPIWWIAVPDSGKPRPPAAWPAQPACRRTTGSSRNRYVARTFIQPGQELRKARAGA